MNKHIEEMRKILNECCNIYDEQGNHIRNKCGECECWSDDNHCCCSYNSKEAEALYNAGYRKSTEVAREIFAKIEVMPRAKDFTKRSQDFEFGYRFAIQEILAELKKKYESEERE